MWRFCRGFDHRNSRQNEWHIFKLQNDIFNFLIHLILFISLIRSSPFLGKLYCPSKKSCRLRLGQNLRASTTTRLKMGLHGLRGSCNVPSGKHTKNYGKSPFLKGKLTISMAMFNSYVKLPEGFWDHDLFAGEKRGSHPSSSSPGRPIADRLQPVPVAAGPSPYRWHGHHPQLGFELGW